MSAEPIRFPGGKRRTAAFAAMRDAAASTIQKADEKPCYETRTHGKQNREERSAGLAEKLLAFEAGLRRPADRKELCYYIANEITGILPARQVIVQTTGATGESYHIEAISALAMPDKDAPLARWLNRVLADELADGAVSQTGAGITTPEALPLRHFRLPAMERDGRAYGYPYVLQLPLVDRDGKTNGVVSLLSDRPHDPASEAIALRVADAISHAATAFAAARPLGAFIRQRQLRWLIAAMLFAALFVPVPLTVLASTKVVAYQPETVTAPLSGVIKMVHLPPNSAVKAGDLLFSYDKTELQNRVDLAVQNIAVAEARLHRANQDAFGSGEGRRELAVAKAELDLALAEGTAARRRLALADVRANGPGVLLFSAIEDWTGRPVDTGERVMRIADPSRIAFSIDLETSDTIILSEDASAKVFLDARPLSPVTAEIDRRPYEPELSETGILSFPIRALPSAEGRDHLRIGQRGTAQLYGSKVPLWFLLFRKPLAYVRQKTGW